MNLYGYAGGDPVNYSDPFGLCPTCENDATLALSVERMESMKGKSIREILWDNFPPIAAVAVVTLGPAATARLGSWLSRGAVVTGAAAAAPKLTIQFGRTANQVYHAFRHTDDLGLDRAAVQAAVQQHLPTVASQLVPGRALNQVITVGGQKLQYSAYEISKGAINVGRIQPVP